MIIEYRNYQGIRFGWRISNFVLSLIFILWFLFSLFWLITDKLHLGILQNLYWVGSSGRIGKEGIVVLVIFFGLVGIAWLIWLLWKVKFEWHDD